MSSKPVQIQVQNQVLRAHWILYLAGRGLKFWSEPTSTYLLSDAIIYWPNIVLKVCCCKRHEHENLNMAHLTLYGSTLILEYVLKIIYDFTLWESLTNFIISSLSSAIVSLTLKAPITTAADDTSYDIFSKFRKK